MNARQSSFTFLTILAVSLFLAGCRGTGPQRQPLVLTEDPAVQVSSDDAPPQRLAMSQRSAKTNRPSATAPLSQQPTKTRLANSRTDTYRTDDNVQSVALSGTATKTQTVAKQPTLAQSEPSAHKPSRSDAVEALLAANRATARVKQRSSAQQTRTQQQRTSERVTSQQRPPVSTNRGATAKPINPIAQTEKPQSKAVARTTIGKTVRFNDLPADVKRRAMDRLIENMAQQAVPTTQPSSLKQGLAKAMENLPGLRPLRKTTPDVLPTRIASTQAAGSKRATSPPADSVRPPASGPPAPGPAATTEKIAVAAKTVPAPKPSKVADEAPHEESAKMPAAAVVAGLQMPPMDAIQTSLPKLDDKKIQMVTTEDLRSKDLSVSSMAQEFETVPGELQRDSFRVSRVGLPDPDDYFASVDADIRQVSSQYGDESLPDTTVELAVPHSMPISQFQSAPTEQDHFLPTSSVDSNESKMHGNVASDSPTPAFDLPTRLEPKPKSSSPPSRSFSMPIAAFSVSPSSASGSSSPAREEIESVSPAVAAIDKKDSIAKTVERVIEAAQPATESVTSTKPIPKPNPQSLSDQELYEALLTRLTDPSKAQTSAEQNRRQIMARHLMVLAGNREAAVKRMDGLSNEEQEFLRNQLEGLHAMVDPKGHPVAGRRFSDALPKLREATQHLSAAADTLEVRGLEFCTEIEAYGQIKPFPTRQFAVGQAVILYCEVDRFTARQTDAGYETHLKGSYDVYNVAGEKIVSQLLPADKQVSRHFLRDYFVAYQMNLPTKLVPGQYRLQLTMEDVDGEKYGQSEIKFEILK